MNYKENGDELLNVMYGKSVYAEKIVNVASLIFCFHFTNNPSSFFIITRDFLRNVIVFSRVKVCTDFLRRSLLPPSFTRSVRDFRISSCDFTYLRKHKRARELHTPRRPLLDIAAFLKEPKKWKGIDI